METTTNAGTAIEKPPRVSKGMTLADLIESKKDSFAKVAVQHYDCDRLVKLAQAMLSRRVDLGKCTPTSVLLCLMKCAELGLEPDSALPQRRMWLVPRWNSKASVTECTPQIDYRAQLQLARDSGLVTSIVAEVVRAKDAFEYEVSAGGDSMVKLRHRPPVFGERGDVIGYYAMAQFEGGHIQAFTMSKADAEVFKRRFGPKKKGGEEAFSPWQTDFDAMALKTVLRRLWNLLPAGQTERARKLQERIAAEADDEIENATAIDIAPEGVRQTATEALKDRLGLGASGETVDVPPEGAEESNDKPPQEESVSGSVRTEAVPPSAAAQISPEVQARMDAEAKARTEATREAGMKKIGDVLTKARKTAALKESPPPAPPDEEEPGSRG